MSAFEVLMKASQSPISFSTDEPTFFRLRLDYR